MASPVVLFRLADDLLRGEAAAIRPGRGTRAALTAVIALMIVGFGMTYGAVMGTFGGWALQLVYSAVKVPILIMLTFALSVPSFYVLHALLGLRDAFPRVIRALLTSQAGLTVILTSLSPFTAFWYAQGTAYRPAILFNGAMFAVASLAQWIVRREYGPLIREDGRHRWMLRTWIFLYVFVGIQMGWVLRPFIGDPDRPVQFFREDSWSNAYEFVLRLIWEVMWGRGSGA